MALHLCPSPFESDPHADDFFDACLHDGAFDAQCEPKRAPWLVELLVAGELVKELTPRVAAALPDVPDDGTDLPHVLAVLVGLARHGGRGARDAVLAELARPRKRNRLELAQAVVALDGPVRIGDALRYLARSAPDDVAAKDVADWYGELVAAHGVDALERAWREDANLDPEADDLWRRAVELWHTERKRSAESVSAFDALSDDERNATFTRLAAARARAIGARSFDELDWTPRDPEADPILHPWGARRDAQSWGRYAADSELERAYAALLDEHDTSRLELLYAVFAHRNLLRLDARLLAHLEHADPRVVEAAAEALGRVRDERVHAAALQRLTAGPGDSNAFRLLRQNWRAGDAARVLDTLPSDLDDDSASVEAADPVKSLVSSSLSSSRSSAPSFPHASVRTLCRAR